MQASDSCQRGAHLRCALSAFEKTAAHKSHFRTFRILKNLSKIIFLLKGFADEHRHCEKNSLSVGRTLVLQRGCRCLWGRESSMSSQEHGQCRGLPLSSGRNHRRSARPHFRPLSLGKHVLQQVPGRKQSWQTDARGSGNRWCRGFSLARHEALFLSSFHEFGSPEKRGGKKNFLQLLVSFIGLPRWLPVVKHPLADVGDLGSIPGLGRSPGGGHGNPLQYSCLENPHGQRSLLNYSPWVGHDWAHMHVSFMAYKTLKILFVVYTPQFSCYTVFSSSACITVQLAFLSRVC